MRNQVSPAQIGQNLSEKQEKTKNLFDAATKDSYNNLFTVHNYLNHKTSKDDLSDDMNFTQGFNIALTQFKDILELVITLLSAQEDTEEYARFFVYPENQNPAPLGPVKSIEICELEKELKTLIEENSGDDLQENMRFQSALALKILDAQTKTLQRQFFEILNFYAQKEGIEIKVNHVTQQIEFISRNPSQDITKKSLRDIFEDLNIQKKDFRKTLNNFSLHLEFIGNYINPYTPDDMKNPDLFVYKENHSKPNQVRELLGLIQQKIQESPQDSLFYKHRFYEVQQYTSANILGICHALLAVLLDDDQFSDPNPAHLTFYYRFLIELESLLDSYVKYLQLPLYNQDFLNVKGPVQDNQNPPLLVHYTN